MPTLFGIGLNPLVQWLLIPALLVFILNRRVLEEGARQLVSHPQANYDMRHTEQRRPDSQVAPPIRRNWVGLAAQNLEHAKRKRGEEQQHTCVGCRHAQPKWEVLGLDEREDEEATNRPGHAQRQVMLQQSFTKGASAHSGVQSGLLGSLLNRQ